MTRNPRVLIVEDEEDILKLLELHLRREGCETGSARDGETALKLLGEGKFDLAVLDWMLPGASGLEVIRKIRTGNVKLPILMVTARADSCDIVAGLEVGADDYVTKPFEIPVLLARVRALLRRQIRALNQDQGSYEVKGLRVHPDRFEVFCRDKKVELTASEFKLLTTLLENQGKALSRGKLIELVRGKGIVVIDRAIDTLVFGLRKKLGDCAEVVETIRGVGYRVRA